MPSRTSTRTHLLPSRNDPDVLRVMVATDNHLGYLGADPVRGEDSFNTFEEILKLARFHMCDMVLLGEWGLCVGVRVFVGVCVWVYVCLFVRVIMCSCVNVYGYMGVYVCVCGRGAEVGSYNTHSHILYLFYTCFLYHTLRIHTQTYIHAYILTYTRTHTYIYIRTNI